MKMEAVEFQSSADRYLISIDKSALDQNTVLKVLEWLTVENLAQRVGIDDSVTELADEMKADWWKQNKHRFIPEGL